MFTALNIFESYDSLDYTCGFQGGNLHALNVCLWQVQPHIDVALADLPREGTEAAALCLRTCLLAACDARTTVDTMPLPVNSMTGLG